MDWEYQASMMVKVKNRKERILMAMMERILMATMERILVIIIVIMTQKLIKNAHYQ